MTKTDRSGLPDIALGRYMALAALAIALLFAGLGGWALTAELAGAVVAGGTIVVDSNVKKVQHPNGGVVGELLVREGDAVRANDVLIRLDETMARANRDIIAKQLDQILMRLARLETERDGAPAITIPEPVEKRRDVPYVAKAIAGETGLFVTRADVRQAQKAQLRERILQLREEISGLRGQFTSKTNEVAIAREELQGLEFLARQNLVQVTKVNALKRDVERLEGERGILTAQIAQAGGKIAEIELQLLQVDQDFRSEVARDLREAQSREGELVERLVAAEDQLKRIDILAPQNGVVHQLSVHTIGGVINAGEQLMLIVPEGDRLIVEARISQQDIEQVRAGQKAWLRMTAFNARTTPELAGTVERVSADLTREAQTGAAYYVARIHPDPGEADKLGGRLLPGMPVEAQIRTTERTAMSYLMKPLSDQFARAFKER